MSISANKHKIAVFLKVVYFLWVSEWRKLRACTREFAIGKKNNNEEWSVEVDKQTEVS